MTIEKGELATSVKKKSENEIHLFGRCWEWQTTSLIVFIFGVLANVDKIVCLRYGFKSRLWLWHHISLSRVLFLAIRFALSWPRDSLPWVLISIQWCLHSNQGFSHTSLQFSCVHSLTVQWLSKKFYWVVYNHITYKEPQHCWKL